jgi:ankyrin repeat protein/uncharacterized protein YegL
VVIQQLVNMNNLKKDLECPLTLELLEDPVRVSCCQKAFSRTPLIQIYNTTQICPNCRAPLTEDPTNSPKDIILAGMVETLQQQEKDPNVPQNWTVTLTPIIDRSGKQLPVGELCVSLENSQFQVKPSLFIAVTDNSGSMAGNPWKQVQTALVHLYAMVRNNPLVKVKWIVYNSMAQIQNVDPQQDQVLLKNAINGVGAGGGTNIQSSFEQIKTIIQEQIRDTDVGNITIAIMTDGQDNATYNKPDEARETLVKEFRETLLDICKGKPVSVCTVGFSQDHDRKLLELFRTAGTIPGTYQYAEPQDGGDILCQKLQGLFEVATKSSSVTVDLLLTNTCYEMVGRPTFINTQFPVDQKRRGLFKCWVVIPADNLGHLVIKSPIDKDTEIKILPGETSNGEGVRLFDKWLSSQVDVLANETLRLGESKPSANILELHCGVLLQKIEAITSVTSSEATLQNLLAIAEQVTSLESGKSVNLGKLADLSYSSRFGAVMKTTVPDLYLPTVRAPESAAAIDNKKVWREMELRRYNRNNADQGRNALQEAIMNNEWNRMTPEIVRCLEASTLDDLVHTDTDGNNALHLSAYCGQVGTTAAILKKHPQFPLETTNTHEETPLTLAIKKRGFWLTIKELLSAGAGIPGGRKSALEQFCINHDFKQTASILSNLSEGGGTSTDINMSMTPSYIEYVYERARANQADIDIQKFLTISLAKVMPKMVETMINVHGAIPTISMLLEYCIPPKPDDPETPKYINLAEIVLAKVPDLVHQVDENGDGPVLISTKKGSLPHVKFFLDRGSELDRQNILGNSPLWVACSQRYPCIIDELLERGADPNLVNRKGNAPMYSVCQRGPKKVIETLLSYGTKVDYINDNGDTLILICCRNGQHEILELLLRYTTPEFVNFKAHIDGFNAIMASAEANRPECVRVLKEYFKDDPNFLNQKTNLDCPVPDVAGGTPLHIATYYNSGDAAKVLLDLGADPNVKDDKFGRTPLHLAVIQGHIPMIKLLRNNGADQTITDNSNNIPAAYCRNKTEIRKVLINPLLDPLMKLCQGGFSKEEEVIACQILREHVGVLGAISPKKSVSLQGDLGITPLVASVIGSKFNIVETLCVLDADPKVKNLHGVDVWLWAEWIGNPRIKHALPKCPHPDQVQEQIKILRAQKNPFVLFLGNQPEQIIPKGSSSGISQRMSDLVNTIGTTIDTSLLQIDSSNGSATRGLQESLKLDLKVYEAILWNARVFTVSVMASGYSINLDANQVVALTMYTSHYQIARDLNLAIVQKGLTERTKMFAAQLYQGLAKIPPLAGAEVYFGARTVHRRLYTVGTEIVWPGFMSASGLWRVAVEACPEFEKVAGQNAKAEGTVFIVQSKTGRTVAQFSQFSYDAEIMFLPGTKFRVVNWYRGDTIALGQANIREHTFKLKDEELDQYIDTQKSMIIELVEVLDI